MQSRRTALVKIASVTASAAVTPFVPKALADDGHHSHEMAEDPAAAKVYKPTFFQAKDYAVVTRLADLIIPRTETPGAIDANVPYRIDQQVDGNKKLQGQFRDGLALLSEESSKLGNKNFAALDEAQQISLLKAMSTAPKSPGGKFFRTMKELTIDWYYRSEQGLVQELGFKGNTFRASFPGCTHPEHWPAQEKS